MDAIKEIMKKREDLKREEEKLNSLLAKIKDSDLSELMAPLDKKLAELDVERKKIIAEKKEIKKQFFPNLKGGKWTCEVAKKGKNIMLTVSHSAVEQPFKKTLANGDPENTRSSYTGIRNAFIKHFELAVSHKAAESYLTNTIREKLNIA